MLLTSYMAEQDVHLDVPADTKDGVLHAAGDALARGDISGADVHALLAQRERVASTGVGEGVAIPHASDAGVTDARVVLLRTAADIDFDAVDGEPVRLVFGVLAPGAAAGLHLRLLARIARIVRTPAVRNGLLEAPNAQAAYSVLRDAEGRTARRR